MLSGDELLSQQVGLQASKLAVIIRGQVFKAAWCSPCAGRLRWLLVSLFALLLCGPKGGRSFSGYSLPLDSNWYPGAFSSALTNLALTCTLLTPAVCRSSLLRQYDNDDLAEGGVPKMLASPELPRTLSDDEGIPCPRRFGATFAANGSLIVFSSSIEVVRAGRKRVEGDGQQVR